jgi:phage-related minor tail protein
MAVQQLMFDILASATGVNKTFDEVANSADSMAGRLGAVGAKATSKLFNPMTAAAAGGIAGAALVGGLQTAVERNSVNSTLANQLNLAAPEAEKAGAVTGDLYNQGFGGSFEGVSTAVGAVLSSVKGMAGASQGDIEALTTRVMALSSTFEIDTARAAQVAGQMINTGLAKNGVEAADLLAATLSKVPVNVREDVLDAVDEYGPMFAALGMSGSEAMSLLADSSAKGMFGIDKTGDALKEFTIRATDMSKASGDAYKSLGLDQAAMTSDLLKGGDTARVAFDKIVAGLGDMKDPVAQSQAALALFGTPLEDLGTSEIPKFIGALKGSKDAMGDVEGASGKLADSMTSGPGAAFTEFQRTAESTLGEIGQQILPILTPILENLAQFAPVIGPAVIALGALAAVIAVVNFVMALNPVTWIIVGIVALIAAIALLVANWDTVVQFLTQVWGGFVNWIIEIVNGFVGWWNGLWAGFFAWTSELWSGFVAWISAIWQGYITWVLGVVNGFVAWWNGMWAGFFAWTSGLWNGFVAGLVGLWNLLVATVIGIVAGFVGFLSGAWSGAVSFAMSIWSGLSGFFSGLWSGIVSGVQTAVGNIGSFFSDLPGKIMGFFAGAGSWLFSFGQDIVNGLGRGLQSMAGSIGNFFLNMLPDWIREPFKAALGIHSPSRVFAGYGENIGEGVLVGVGRMQDRIDARMSSLVTVPDLPSDAEYSARSNSMPRSSSSRPRQSGKEEGATYVNIEGNVYGNPEDIVQEINLSKRRAVVVNGLRAVAAGV